MAETVNLKIILDGKGIKTVTSDLGKLNKTTEKVKKQSQNLSNSSNKLKRNLEGVSQRANNTSKDFSRMSQGMGGLVAAYATVAANVFALSTAFLVLRNAADLSSMVKSAENFSNRYGVSVTSMTKNIQAATGGALSFADALPTINKAISAGLGEDKITQLAVAATKASQTFGGTANEALNRFISAAQRGRVEVVNTLGIVIQTEQEYRKYAATIGKTAQELTAFDRQQAIVNAVIEESANVFDKVNIDPNPFQQLLTTMTDLKDTMLTTVTDAITPLINAFNKSKSAALAFFALIAGSIGSKLFPQIEQQIISARKKGLEAGVVARAARRLANEKEKKFLLETQRQITGLTSKQLKQRSLLFRNHYAEILQQHKSFGKQLINDRGEINRAVLNEQRAAIARELKARALGKPGQTAFIGIGDPALENERNRLAVLGNELGKGVVAQKNFARATAVTDQQVQTFIAKASVGFTRLKANISSAASAFKSGFAQTFALTQTSVIQGIRGMGSAWLQFARTVAAGNASAAFISFSKAVGRSAGVLIGTLSKLLSAFTSITLAISIGTFIWGKYGDKIRGISPEQRKIIDAGDELQKSIEEINKRTSEAIVLLGEEAPNSLKKLRDGLQFTAGTFSSIATAINKFRQESIEAFGGKTVNAISSNIKTIKAEIESIKRVSDFDLFIRARDRSNDPITKRVEALNKELTESRKQIDIFVNNATPELVRALSSAFNFADQIGFKNVMDSVRVELLKAAEDVGGVVVAESLVRDLSLSIESGDEDKIRQTLNRIKLNFGEASEELADFITALLRGTSNMAGIMSEVSNTNANAIKQLEETGGRIATFIGGIDKLRTQSAPNKEIVGFVLDINAQLKELEENQKNLKNITLAEQFTDPEQLTNIKALFGFVKGETVDLETLRAKGLVLQEDFLNQLRAETLITEQIKTIQLELSALKKQEAKTDEQRVSFIERRIGKEKEQLKLEIQKANFNVVAQQRVVDLAKTNLDISEDQKRIDREKLANFEAEQRALQIELRILNENLEAERERAKIRTEIIDSNIAMNSTMKEILAIEQGLTTSFSQDLMVRKAILSNERESLSLKKAAVEEQIRSFDINKDTEQQDQRARNEANLKLELLKAQSRELDRQNLLIKARELQDAGTQFTSEGMVVLAQIFTRTLQDGVRGLEPSITILAKGFADTLNNTIDSIVDKLISTGSFSEFGRVLRETIKAGLREAFGDAIKARIKEAFADLFQKEKEKSEEVIASEKLKETIEAQKTILESNTAAIKELTMAINSMPGGGGGGGEGSENASLNILQTIAHIGEGTNNSIKGLEGLTSKGNEIQNEAKEEAKKGFGGLIQTIVKFITSMFSSTGSGSGGFWDTIINSVIGGFFADGGVVSGMRRIPRHANGTITNGPELAVIGEGKTKEAVIPLPNNKEVPVQLMGGSGGDTINITQNYDFSNADNNTVSKLRTEARAIEERTFNRVFTEINKGGRYAKIAGRR